MKGFNRNYLIMCVCIAVACFCAYAAYNIIKEPKSLEARGAGALNDVKAAAVVPALGAAAAAGGWQISGGLPQASSQTSLNNLPGASSQAQADGPRIQPSTMILYRYLYSGDGTTAQTEAQAPYFLVNMDRARLAENFPDWAVISFDQDEVVLQKTVEGRSNQHYIVGEFNGYVAVFFREGENRGNLMQVTSAPVFTFSRNEQQQLTEGISVDGKENLYKILQDYES